MASYTETAAFPAIDVHTHMVPARIPAYGGSRSDVPWPSVEHHRSCGARVMIAGKMFREIEDSCWNTQRRGDDMASMAVTTQVLSPMPELMSYWMDAEDTASLGRHINADIAAMVSEGNGRFRGLGMVPLQDPRLAAAELHHLMDTLGLSGAEIGTNVLGRPIGDPFFEPFFAAAEASEALIFVHPLRAAGRDQVVGPPGLEQIVAFPCETALAIASMITGGMLSRHPQLKLVFSHGGGAFAQILPRLQHAWSFMPALQDAAGASPVELSRRLFFDSLVYSPVALRFLIEQFGAAQICIGTDYPFAILDRTPLTGIRAIGLNQADLRAVCSGNLLGLLRR